MIEDKFHVAYYSRRLGLPINRGIEWNCCLNCSTCARYFNFVTKKSNFGCRYHPEMVVIHDPDVAFCKDWSPVYKGDVIVTASSVFNLNDPSFDSFVKLILDTINIVENEFEDTDHIYPVAIHVTDGVEELNDIQFRRISLDNKGRGVVEHMKCFLPNNIFINLKNLLTHYKSPIYKTPTAEITAGFLHEIIHLVKRDVFSERQVVRKEFRLMSKYYPGEVIRIEYKKFLGELKKNQEVLLT